jgi:hypothetical protein
MAVTARICAAMEVVTAEVLMLITIPEGSESDGNYLSLFSIFRKNGSGSAASIGIDFLVETEPDFGG